MKNRDLKSLGKALGKNKYVLILAALALVLIAFPSGSSKSEASSWISGESQSSAVVIDEESAKLADLISSIEGVGEAKVLLSSEGAVIVCDGADSSAVCLCVTNAVSVYTGLGSDKIEVIKMN
ncbi:MAG: hypothetical protein IKV79_07510 [Oscillospiraceae bacterium]|nr:hypothetical protein [Oscillospiraceae bacterium]